MRLCHTTLMWIWIRNVELYGDVKNTNTNPKVNRSTDYCILATNCVIDKIIMAIQFISVQLSEVLQSDW